jgi:hypothetical protein
MIDFRLDWPSDHQPAHQTKPGSAGSKFPFQLSGEFGVLLLGIEKVAERYVGARRQGVDGYRYIMLAGCAHRRRGAAFQVERARSTGKKSRYRVLPI